MILCGSSGVANDAAKSIFSLLISPNGPIACACPSAADVLMPSSGLFSFARASLEMTVVAVGGVGGEEGDHFALDSNCDDFE